MKPYLMLLLLIPCLSWAATDFSTYNPRPYDVTRHAPETQQNYVASTLHWIARNVELDHIEIGYSNDASQRDRQTSVILNHPDEIQTAFFDRMPAGRYHLDIDFIENGKIYWRCYYILDIPENRNAANQVTLNWQIPSQRENGDALNSADIAGFEIYHAANIDSDKPVEEIVTIDSNQQTSLVLDELVDGEHHFAIATVDSTGLRSSLSEVVSTNVSSLITSAPAVDNKLASY